MATNKLTELAVRKAKPGDRPVRMFDGARMYLEVQPSGSKWWRHKFRFGGRKEVGALLRSIIDYEGHPVTRAALVLSALVFQRPGNVRAAEWGEVDLDGALWTVPSAKVKRTVEGRPSGRPHLIPLSTQAVAELTELRKLTGHGRFVFRSLLTGERCMSENTVNTALRRMGTGRRR